MSHGRRTPDVLAPRSRFYQGSYGRICGDLEPWAPENVEVGALEKHFLDLANDLMVEEKGKEPSEIANNRVLRKKLDLDFDSDLPAGYTYFGQFVDHDVTLDITGLSDAHADPDRILNFRTPRLDLDCVYGRGPDDQPYLYHVKDSPQAGELIVGKIPGTEFPDLHRTAPLEGEEAEQGDKRQAIIGDKRNDENAMVTQMQLAFILAHNKLVQRYKDDHPEVKDPEKLGAAAFKEARRTLTWLYQWIVWNDFLERVTLPEMRAAALIKDKLGGGTTGWRLGLEHVYNWKDQPFMPLEFSVAAYRFGHSLVRNSYKTNPSVTFAEETSTPEEIEELFRPIPIFDVNEEPKEDLSGFRALSETTRIQWDWFLQMSSSDANFGFPQRARKIDPKLSNALTALRETPKDNSSNQKKLANVLAARNLIRGVRMKLPSGPDVARKFGLTPITLEDTEPKALWYYILKEAEIQGNKGETLGELGSLIVCAVFAGLLKGDSQSWFNRNPEWAPEQEMKDGLLRSGDDEDDKNWGLASIIRIAGLS